MPGLSLGCPAEGGTVPVCDLLGLPTARSGYSAKSSGFEARETRICPCWITCQLLSHLIPPAPVSSCGRDWWCRRSTKAGWAPIWYPCLRHLRFGFCTEQPSPLWPWLGTAFRGETGDPDSAQRERGRGSGGSGARRPRRPIGQLLWGTWLDASAAYPGVPPFPRQAVGGAFRGLSTFSVLLAPPSFGAVGAV